MTKLLSPPLPQRNAGETSIKTNNRSHNHGKSLGVQLFDIESQKPDLAVGSFRSVLTVYICWPCRESGGRWTWLQESIEYATPKLPANIGRPKSLPQICVLLSEEVQALVKVNPRASWLFRQRCRAWMPCFLLNNLNPFFMIWLIFARILIQYHQETQIGQVCGPDPGADSTKEDRYP